ncbi:MAG: RNA polymerase sigma factor [Patescibacteria group bacterium]
MEGNEANIIKQCQRGNLEKFGELYDQYIKKIYNFIFYKTGQKETAEDLTSHTFIKALENIGKYNSTKGSFSSWLYRIARNTVIDYYRTRKENFDITDFTNLSSDENLEDQTDLKQQLEKVQKYLLNLKAEQREIIIMRVWDGLSYEEISQITGKSQASCKMLFLRTINKLRKDLPLNILILLLLKL